eukprot:GEMP01048950.1.p1 GENE.GEMP01048950.1~~GEMP01048950.1.p1  ORF type:complete len:490 (+),score=140.67 GEMP01048950.1:89-1558(+)
MAGDMIDVLGNGKLMKEIITAPEEDAPMPEEGDTVFVHYTGTVKETGKKFDSSRDRHKPFDFRLGRGVVIQGWDDGVKTMKKGERAKLTIHSELAYGSMGAGPDIGPDTDLCFDVELIRFEKPKRDKEQMDDAERLQEAIKCKEEGNEAFKKQEFNDAADKYMEGLEFLSNQDQDSNSDEPCVETDMGKAADVAKTLKLNYANACLKNKQYSNAIQYATKVLEKDAVCTKALYRRGMAQLGLCLVEEAKADFVSAVKAEPQNREFRAKVAECKKLLVEAKEKEKDAYGGMFGKLNMYTEKKNIVVLDHKVEMLPKVYMDIKVGDAEPERVVFALYSDSVPKTAENFRALCTGEKGTGPRSNLRLHFKGCYFHRLISGFMMQGGDFQNGDGTGGESIYGNKFDDENFADLHTKPGLLSMANSGENTNGSQFFVTFKETPHLDGKHVVFGEVVEGMEFIKKLEDLPTGKNDEPEEKVLIADCGELSDAMTD